MDESIIKRGKIEKIAKMPMMSECILCIFFSLLKFSTSIIIVRYKKKLGKICYEINQPDRTTKDLATQNGRRRVQVTSCIAWV